MPKYDNYIFLTICEISYKNSLRSNYSTYVEYCRGMAQSLKDDNVSNRDMMHLHCIIEEMDTIFSLSPVDTGNYISDFFNLDSDRLLEFQKIVQMTNSLFPPLEL